MLALGFLGQEGKDDLAEEDVWGRPGYNRARGLDSLGVAQRALASSGLLGTQERWLNILHNPYGGSSDPVTWAANTVKDNMGPALGQIKGMGSVTDGVFNGFDNSSRKALDDIATGKGVYNMYAALYNKR